MMMLCYVVPCHIMLRHVMSCHVILCYVMSYYVISCHIMLCHVTSRHVISCNVLSCYNNVFKCLFNTRIEDVHVPKIAPLFDVFVAHKIKFNFN